MRLVSDMDEELDDVVDGNGDPAAAMNAETRGSMVSWIVFFVLGMKQSHRNAKWSR